MKKTILALSILAINATVIAQDTMRMNTNISGRVAARDMRGATDPPALPVIETFVPQEAASLASGKYGKALYSVKQLRVASGDSAYQVTLLDTSSGQTRLEWIGGDGAVVTNIYRVDTGEMANQMNPNMAVTDTSMNNMNNMNRDTSMRNMNNMNRDTSMRKDTMNMNRDTSMRNMNNMNRDTSIRNMNNMNNKDTTRRDSVRSNGTSYIDIKFKMSEGGKPGEDLNIVLSKLITPMKFVGDITLIHRRLNVI
ncbi:MAG: hypothetical protein M3352_10330 [Bacteroidota bacterium]|nr:hypothetical protein [Bacteroidota bacterium]